MIPESGTAKGVGVLNGMHCHRMSEYFDTSSMILFATTISAGPLAPVAVMASSRIDWSCVYNFTLTETET